MKICGIDSNLYFNIFYQNYYRNREKFSKDSKSNLFIPNKNFKLDPIKKASLSGKNIPMVNEMKKGNRKLQSLENYNTIDDSIYEYSTGISNQIRSVNLKPLSFNNTIMKTSSNSKTNYRYPQTDNPDLLINFALSVASVCVYKDFVLKQQFIEHLILKAKNINSERKINTKKLSFNRILLNNNTKLLKMFISFIPKITSNVARLISSFKNKMNKIFKIQSHVKSYLQKKKINKLRKSVIVIKVALKKYWSFKKHLMIKNSVKIQSSFRKL